MSVVQRLPWRSVLWSSGLLALGYTCYSVFVRPFLSPLRKIPGLPYKPIVGNIGELRAGEAMEASIKMMENYGTIVRYYFFFGTERLLIACPETIKQILVTNCKNYIKPPDRIKLMRMVLGDGLVILEGKEHAAHKRIMAPSFNHSSIKSMIPAFEEVSDRLAEYWKDTCLKDGSTGTAQVQVDMARTTLDVIGRTAFGYDFNSLRDPQNRTNRAFREILTGAGISWKMMIPYWYKVPFGEAANRRKMVGIMNEKVMEVIQHKRAQIEEQQDVCGDILGVMMMARDITTGEGLSDTELQNEVKTLMFAGHETTASALTWCLLVLAQHPAIQEHCRQEAITHATAYDHMTYITNTIKETLRMYPVVPLTVRQALHDDTFQGKYFIPAGTISVIAIGPMMRSPQLFKDPNTFNPDRFTEGDENSTMYSFLPFLIGPRMCLGYKFALLEMKVILATLLRNFTFELLPDSAYERRSGITMRPSPHVELKITRVQEK